MDKTVYIVRDSELGWDNIVGIYTTEESAEQAVEHRGGDTTWWDSSTLEEKFEVY